MNAASIIAKTRDGLELTSGKVAMFVEGFSRGEVPDYQMAALAMAIYIRGMTTAETAMPTEQMLSSGQLFEMADGRAAEGR